MNKPNLFEIGTKELAQDAFLTWLISYADNQYIGHKELNTLAKEFIKMMIGNNNLNIEKVYCWRQWEKIDISVTVNDKYFIIIEDKTGTNQHGNQLSNYKEKAQDHCNKNNLELVCIFLKTRDDSTYTINSVEREGYKYISRNDLLSLFEKHSHIKNDIFIDYLENLKNIEQQSKLYMTDFQSVKWNYLSCCGLYKELEKRITELAEKKIIKGDINRCNWGYVPNQNGGFLGFWFYPVSADGIEFYPIIENYYNNGNIRASIKVLYAKDNLDKLYKVLNILTKNGSKYNFEIKKPVKYKKGENATAAIIKDDICGSTKEDFFKDIENMLVMLDNLEI